jgi:hypothetical protein
MSQDKLAFVQSVIDSPITAKTVSGGTIISGVGTVLNYVELPLGIVAILLGIALSTLLYRNNMIKRKIFYNDLELGKKNLIIADLRIEEEKKKLEALTRQEQ